MPRDKAELALQVVIALLFAGLFWVVLDTVPERVVKVGDKAPSFRVVTDSGRTVTRSDFGGRLLVLNFWATWCPPCIEEMPSLDQFHKEMASRGVVVLGISVDRNEKLYRDFLARAKVSFLTARDPGAEISASYGTFKYPETYVINARGEVIEKFIGPENWMDSRLIARIKSLL